MHNHSIKITISDNDHKSEFSNRTRRRIWLMRNFGQRCKKCSFLQMVVFPPLVELQRVKCSMCTLWTLMLTFITRVERWILSALHHLHCLYKYVHRNIDHIIRNYELCHHNGLEYSLCKRNNYSNLWNKRVSTFIRFLKKIQWACSYFRWQMVSENLHLSTLLIAFFANLGKTVMST